MTCTRRTLLFQNQVLDAALWAKTAEQREGLRGVIRQLRRGEIFEIYCDDGDRETDCPWDGQHRRCSCGNRRVCWTWEDDQHEWVPEAW